jgi:hypothetical protein
MPRRLLALLSLAVLAPAAPANGLGLFRRHAPVETAYYYYPAVSVYYYYAPPVVWPSVPVVPLEVAPVEPLQPTFPTLPIQPMFPAQPVQPIRGLPPVAPVEPAQPSVQPYIPPPMPMQPAEPVRVVSAKVSAFAPTLRHDLYPTATVERPLPTGRFALTVWNLSAGDLTVRIDGRDLPLPRGRSASLEVGRDFTWEADGTPHSEKVPEGRPGVTLTLR